MNRFKPVQGLLLINSLGFVTVRRSIFLHSCLLGVVWMILAGI